MRPRRSVVALLLWVLLGALALPNPTWTAPLPLEPRPVGEEPQIVRIYVKDQAQVAALLALGLDLLETRGPDYLLALTDAKTRATLREAGYLVVPDARQSESLARFRAVEAFRDGYHTVAETVAYLQEVANRYPDLAQLVDYGDSWLKIASGHSAGHDLWALRLTNRAVPGPKPVFFLMAAIHARELATTELALNFVAYLVQGYGNDPEATWLLDWHEIWVAPITNPDGRLLAEQGYYQRKNVNNQNGGLCDVPPTISNQYGTDLNRNASFGWSNLPPGASGDPCSQVYAGPSPASEPEEAALEALLRSLFADQRGPNLWDPAPDTAQGILISLHSYGELVLWPWGFTTNPAPNRADLQRLGDKFAYYNGYLSCQPASCLYPTSGTTDDWAYGVLGIAAFTFEVGNAFFQPYRDISRIWQENFPALLYAAKVAPMPYRLVRGPDTIGPRSISAGPGMPVLVEATISDVASGQQPIAAAEAYLDVPPWAGGVPLALSAADGAFNAPVEVVRGALSPLDIAAGRHLVFVRGRDVEGHWGPVSALFVEVTGTPATPTPTPKPTRRPRLSLPIPTTAPG